MKRSEFIAIANEVAQEERKALSEAINKAVESAKNDDHVLAELLAQGLLQAIDSSARSTAKIIERLGLVPLTDD